jgi:hypothetical protein
MKPLGLMVALLFATRLVLFSKPAAAQVATAETSSEGAASSSLPPAPKFFYSTEYESGKVGGYLVNPSTGKLLPQVNLPCGRTGGRRELLQTPVAIASMSLIKARMTFLRTSSTEKRSRRGEWLRPADEGVRRLTVILRRQSARRCESWAKPPHRGTRGRWRCQKC